jgi:TonB-dependent receptor
MAAMSRTGEMAMRLKTIALCSTSMLFWATVTPALAQTATPDAAPAAQATDDASDTDIIVTGFRESLQSSQRIKRNSVQVIDSVVAEDIGKLPDLAVSDTAARLPGVQVIRLGGEASNVLVRGLDERYFNTVYNGREIFTAERRQVALQDFPSAGIAALEVFKTSTANLVEPGLAGLVNVRSRRPLDFDKGQISGTAWGLFTKQGDTVTPNGNLLLTDRWDTGIGEIGVLLNGSYTEMQYLDSEPSNTDFIANPTINGTETRFPDIQRLFYRSGNRVRPSVNGAIQWRPSPGLEFYAEALWQGFRNKIDDRLLEVPLYGATYSNLVYRDGTNLLRSGTATNPGNRIFTFQGATYNKTDTYQYAVGGSYVSGPFKLTADLARTESTFTGSTESLDRVFNGGYTADFNLDTPQFTLSNIVLNDPANSTFQGLYEQNQRSSGKDWQARVDATYSFDNFFVKSIQIGGRYTDRNALRQFSDRYNNVLGQNISGASLPVTYAQINPGFRGSGLDQTRSFFSPTYDSIRENIAALRTIAGYGTTPPAPFTQYTATEETMAGYAQVNFAFGDTIEATVGVRATKAKTRVTGTAAGLLPGSGGDAWEFLPNASALWRITPELQLRLSATQTITRPVFADLNPATSLGPPPGVIVPNPTDPYVNARRGNSGNPFLEPLRSDNYDAGLEYYFSPTGFASVTAFRRDLKGFVVPTEFRFIDPTLGPLIITAPVNSTRGRVDGLEAQMQTFFDFDFLPEFVRSFGIQANYTLLDAKTGGSRILGTSKWSYNLVGLYEHGPLSARLTYNKRGPTLERSDDRGNDLYIETASFPARLDLSTNLAFRDNATLFFDWTNILAKPFRQDFSSARDGAPRADYVRFLRYEETTFSLGLRFKL